MKRTIAIILTIIMVIGLIPTSIYAFSISTAPKEHEHNWISFKEGEWFCGDCGKFTAVDPNPSDDAP